ncbi:Glyoxalase-like domain protein [Phycisphaerae bacterium RAS1]|nr:Glyoxalase-like domain protein [Phycisphaerae bacterium RAS1]
MSKLPPIPPASHTVTPSLVVKDADAAIALYKKAFGAEEIMVLRSPNGGVMHAEIKIGDSTIMLGGEWPDHGMKAPLPGHCSGGLHIYVADADKAFQRAVDAGCTVVMPPADMFWGDRYAKVKDPSGHQWGIATRIEEVSPEECARRAAAWKPQCS